MSFFDKIFDFFRHDDLGAKTICILMAIGLWYYVMTEQNPVSERIVEVKLTPVNQSQEYFISDIPQKVVVTVRGPRININRDLENKIFATVDFKNANVGQQTFPVIVKSDSGTVLNYSPRDISVYVDTFSEKRVAVNARSLGKSSDDLALGKCTIEPSEVIVRGATRRVNAINRVVAPVNISGQTENFQTECNLVAVNDYGVDVPNMRIMPATVTVNAQLVSQMHSVDIPVVPNVSGELPEGTIVSKIVAVPNHIRVTAPPSVLNSIKEIKTKPLQANAITGSQEFACELDLPDKVLPETRTVKVRVSVEPKKTDKQENTDKQEKLKKDETKNQ